MNLGYFFKVPNKECKNVANRFAIYDWFYGEITKTPLKFLTMHEAKYLLEVTLVKYLPT